MDECQTAPACRPIGADGSSTSSSTSGAYSTSSAVSISAGSSSPLSCYSSTATNRSSSGRSSIGNRNQATSSASTSCPSSRREATNQIRTDTPPTGSAFITNSMVGRNGRQQTMPNRRHRNREPPSLGATSHRVAAPTKTSLRFAVDTNADQPADVPIRLINTNCLSNCDVSREETNRAPNVQLDRLQCCLLIDEEIPIMANQNVNINDTHQGIDNANHTIGSQFCVQTLRKSITGTSIQPNDLHANVGDRKKVASIREIKINGGSQRRNTSPIGGHQDRGDFKVHDQRGKQMILNDRYNKQARTVFSTGNTDSRTLRTQRSASFASKETNLMPDNSSSSTITNLASLMRAETHDKLGLGFEAQKVLNEQKSSTLNLSKIRKESLRTIVDFREKEHRKELSSDSFVLPKLDISLKRGHRAASHDQLQRVQPEMALVSNETAKPRSRHIDEIRAIGREYRESKESQFSFADEPGCSESRKHDDVISSQEDNSQPNCQCIPNDAILPHRNSRHHDELKQIQSDFGPGNKRKKEMATQTSTHTSNIGSISHRYIPTQYRNETIKCHESLSRKEFVNTNSEMVVNQQTEVENNLSCSPLVSDSTGQGGILCESHSTNRLHTDHHDQCCETLGDDIDATYSNINKINCSQPRPINRNAVRVGGKDDRDQTRMKTDRRSASGFECHMNANLNQNPDLNNSTSYLTHDTVGFRVQRPPKCHSTIGRSDITTKLSTEMRQIESNSNTPTPNKRRVTKLAAATEYDARGVSSDHNVGPNKRAYSSRVMFDGGNPMQKVHSQLNKYGVQIIPSVNGNYCDDQNDDNLDNINDISRAKLRGATTNFNGSLNNDKNNHPDDRKTATIVASPVDSDRDVIFVNGQNNAAGSNKEHSNGCVHRSSTSAYFRQNTTLNICPTTAGAFIESQARTSGPRSSALASVSRGLPRPPRLVPVPPPVIPLYKELALREELNKSLDNLISDQPDKTQRAERSVIITDQNHPDDDYDVDSDYDDDDGDDNAEYNGDGEHEVICGDDYAAQPQRWGHRRSIARDISLGNRASRSTTSSTWRLYASEWEILKPTGKNRKYMSALHSSIVAGKRDCKSFHSQIFPPQQDDIEVPAKSPLNRVLSYNNVQFATGTCDANTDANEDLTGNDSSRRFKQQQQHQHITNKWRIVKKISKRLLVNLLSTSSSLSAGKSVSHSDLNTKESHLNCAKQCGKAKIKASLSSKNVHHQMRMKLLLNDSNKLDLSSESLNIDFSEPLYDTPEQNGGLTSKLPESSADGDGNTHDHDECTRLCPPAERLGVRDIDIDSHSDTSSDRAIQLSSRSSSLKREAGRSRCRIETPILRPLRAPAAVQRALRPNMPPPPPPPPLPQSKQHQQASHLTGHFPYDPVLRNHSHCVEESTKLAGNLELEKSAEIKRETRIECGDCADDHVQRAPDDCNPRVVHDDDERSDDQVEHNRKLDRLHKEDLLVRKQSNNRSSGNRLNTKNSRFIEFKKERQKEVSRSETKDSRLISDSGYRIESIGGNEICHRVAYGQNRFRKQAQTYEQLSSEIKEAQTNLIDQLIERSKSLVGHGGKLDPHALSQRDIETQRQKDKLKDLQLELLSVTRTIRFTDEDTPISAEVVALEQTNQAPTNKLDSPKNIDISPAPSESSHHYNLTINEPSEDTKDSDELSSQIYANQETKQQGDNLKPSSKGHQRQSFVPEALEDPTKVNSSNGTMGSSNSTLNLANSVGHHKTKNHRRKSTTCFTASEPNEASDIENNCNTNHNNSNNTNSNQLTGLHKHLAFSKKLAHELSKRQQQHERHSSLASLINSQNCSTTSPLVQNNSHSNSQSHLSSKPSKGSFKAKNQHSPTNSFRLAVNKKVDADMLELGELIEQSDVFIHPKSQIEQHEQFWHDCIEAKRTKRLESATVDDPIINNHDANNGDKTEQSERNEPDRDIATIVEVTRGASDCLDAHNGLGLDGSVVGKYVQGSSKDVNSFNQFDNYNSINSNVEKKLFKITITTSSNNNCALLQRKIEDHPQIDGLTSSCSNEVSDTDIANSANNDYSSTSSSGNSVRYETTGNGATRFSDSTTTTIIPIQASTTSISPERPLQTIELQSLIETSKLPTTHQIRTLSGKRRDFLANRTTINLFNTTPYAAPGTTTSLASPAMMMLVTDDNLTDALKCSPVSSNDFDITQPNSETVQSIYSFESVDSTKDLDQLTNVSGSIGNSKLIDITDITNNNNTAEQDSQDRCLSSLSMAMSLSMSMSMTNEESMSSSMANDLDDTEVTGLNLNAPSLITGCEPLVVTTSEMPETVLVDQLANSTSTSADSQQQQLTTSSQVQNGVESPKKSIFDGASKDEILEYLEDARERVPEVLMAADDVMVLNENELIVVNQLDPSAPATPISIVELTSVNSCSNQPQHHDIGSLDSTQLSVAKNHHLSNQLIQQLSPENHQQSQNQIININLMRPKSEIDITQREKVTNLQIIDRHHNHHLIYHHHHDYTTNISNDLELRDKLKRGKTLTRQNAPDLESIVGSKGEIMTSFLTSLHQITSGESSNELIDASINNVVNISIPGNGQDSSSKTTISSDGRRHMHMLLRDQATKERRNSLTTSISLSTGSGSNPGSTDSSPIASSTASPSTCSSSESPDINKQCQRTAVSSTSSSTDTDTRQSTRITTRPGTRSNANSGYNSGSSLSSSSPLLLVADNSAKSISFDSDPEKPDPGGQHRNLSTGFKANLDDSDGKFQASRQISLLEMTIDNSKLDTREEQQENQNSCISINNCNNNSNSNSQREIDSTTIIELMTIDNNCSTAQVSMSLASNQQALTPRDNNCTSDFNNNIGDSNNNIMLKQQLITADTGCCSELRASGPSDLCSMVDKRSSLSLSKGETFAIADPGAGNNFNANAINISNNNDSDHNNTNYTDDTTDPGSTINSHCNNQGQSCIAVQQEQRSHPGSAVINAAGAGKRNIASGSLAGNESLNFNFNNMNRLNYYLQSRQQCQQQSSGDTRLNKNKNNNTVMPLLMRRRQRGGSDSPSFGPMKSGDNARDFLSKGSVANDCYFLDNNKMEFQCPDCDQFLDLSNSHSASLLPNINSGSSFNENGLHSQHGRTLEEQIKMNRVFELLDDLQQLQANNKRDVISKSSNNNNTNYNNINFNINSNYRQQLNNYCSDQLEQAYIAAINGLPLCKICEKKRSERKEIIWEFVDTEIKYGRDLKIIHDEFMRPMQIAGLLTKDQIQGIFLNLDELITANCRFVARLEMALDKSQKIGDYDLNSICIGKMFIECSEMLHSFESYCVRQSTAACLLARLAKEKDLLRIFLRVSQMENTLLRRMNLAAFLVVPVQRVTRYPLLLNRLYKVTAYHHKDRESLRDAQLRVELHLDHINRQTKDLNCGATNKIWRRISNLSGPMSGSISSSSFIHSSLSSQSSSSGSHSISSSLSAQRRALMMNTDDIDCIKLRKAALDILQWDRDETHFIHSGILHFTQLNEFLVKQKVKSLRYMPANALLIVLGKPNWKYRPDLIKPNLDNRLMTPTQPGGGCGIRDAVLMLFREKNGRFVLNHEPLSLSNCVLSNDCSQFNSECPAPLSAPPTATTTTPALAQGLINTTSTASVASGTSTGSKTNNSTTPAINHHQQSNHNDSARVSASSGTSNLRFIINPKGDINSKHQPLIVNGLDETSSSIVAQAANSTLQSSDRSESIESSLVCQKTNSYKQQQPKSITSMGAKLSNALPQSSIPSINGLVGGTSDCPTSASQNIATENLGPKRTGSAGSCGNGSLWRQESQYNVDNDQQHQRRTNSYNEGSTQSSRGAFVPNSQANINLHKGPNNNNTIMSSSSITSPNETNNNIMTTQTNTSQNQIQHEPSSNLNYSHHLHFHNHHQQPYGVYEESFELHERLTKESLLLRADTPLKTRYWLQMLRYHAKDLGQWRQRRSGLANIMMMRREQSS